MLPLHRIHQDLIELGALIPDTHLLLENGEHRLTYTIDKSSVTRSSLLMMRLANQAAIFFDHRRVDVVLAAEKVGCVFGFSLAFQFQVQGSFRRVEFLTADKSRTGGGFIYTHPAKGDLAGKKFLLAEDKIRTGKSLIDLKALAESLKGVVVGAATLFNPGGKTAANIGVPELHTVVDTTIQTWPANECPLCQLQNAP